MGSLSQRSQVRLQKAVDGWALRMRGWTFEQIGERIGYTRQGARVLLARYEKRLIARLDRNIERIKVRHTAQLEYMYGLAIRSYERSCGPTEVVKTSYVQPGGTNECDYVHIDPSVFDEPDSGLGPPPSSGNGDSKYMAKQDKRRAEQRIERIQRIKPGDPALLREAREALSDIRRIWGVDAPIQREVKRNESVHVTNYTENVTRIYGDAPACIDVDPKAEPMHALTEQPTTKPTVPTNTPPTEPLSGT